MVTGSTEQELKIKEGCTYLVKDIYFYGQSLQEMYFERITKDAYKLRKERSNGTWYIEWMEKSKFHQKNEILELLDQPINPPALDTERVSIDINPPNQTNAKMKPCPVCNGMGELPDEKSSTGKSTCPKCWGTGYIFDPTM